ncbi:hypothetical protein D3P05_12595 [Paracoccus siganidrum]|uniref:Uncharacterized protein n=1 Tax=Paracoccus siganidrum TaxID=1276757 RepID=A0A419A623_9RHOB|nr:hypothetical protein D3P05_12595 [Paracoccus siganidrum]
MPRWLKMSPILPIAWVTRPASKAMSRIVSEGGAMAKSRRLGVRRKRPGASPRKGRAITRPTRIRCSIGASPSHSAISRFSPKRSSCAAICSTLSAEV